MLVAAAALRCFASPLPQPVIAAATVRHHRVHWHIGGGEQESLSHPPPPPRGTVRAACPGQNSSAPAPCPAPYGLAAHQGPFAAMAFRFGS